MQQVSSNLPAAALGRHTDFGLVALAAALAYMLLLGGSELGMLVPHLRVASAVTGGTLVAWWIVVLRKGADRVDLLSVAALLVYLVASVASQHPRQSFDAATSALAWTAAFGIGRRVCARSGARTMALGVLAAGGVVLMTVFGVTWSQTWLTWVSLTAEVPPLNLPLPAHFYRHYYVVAMALAALAPAIAYFADTARPRAPWLVAALTAAGLAMLTGSRTVWFGFGLLLAATAMLGARRRPRLVASVGAATGFALVIALMTGALAWVGDRALSLGTVTARLDIWGHTLRLFAADPATGIGPGAFGMGITTTGLMSTYPFEARHADNTVIQLLGEAGVLGAIMVSLAVAALMAGRRLDLPGSRHAGIGLILLGAFSLTNNPTDTPMLVAITVTYAALVTPKTDATSGAVIKARLPSIAWAAVSVPIAAAAGATAFASFAHMQSLQAAAANDWEAARSHLSVAARLDPGMGLYIRELAAVSVQLGNADEARALLEQTIQENGADTAALRLMAIVEHDGGGSGAVHARRAAELRPLEPENGLTLATVSTDTAQHDALVATLATAPWLPASSAWNFSVSPTSIDSIYARARQQSEREANPYRAMARSWLAGTNHPTAGAAVPSAGLRAVVACRLHDAAWLYRELGTKWANSSMNIVGRLMLARVTGESADSLIAIARLRNPALAAAAARPVMPVSIAADRGEDIRLYGRMGMGALTPGLEVPRTSDALSVWMRLPLKAAADSPSTTQLDSCRSTASSSMMVP